MYFIKDFKIEKNKYLVGEYSVLYDKLYEAVIFLQNYLKDPVEFGLANIDKRFLVLRYIYSNSLSSSNIHSYSSCSNSPVKTSL